jgi:hypothetical protein
MLVGVSSALRLNLTGGTIDESNAVVSKMQSWSTTHSLCPVAPDGEARRKRERER